MSVPDASRRKTPVYCIDWDIQLRNYQVSKKVVHEIKFGDIAVMKI